MTYILNLLTLIKREKSFFSDHETLIKREKNVFSDLLNESFGSMNNKKRIQVRLILFSSLYLKLR